MYRDVQTIARLKFIQAALNLGDGLIAAIEGAAQNAHHANRVPIAMGRSLLAVELEPLGRDRH